MSFEHHPIRGKPETAASLDGAPRGPPEASDYWQALIDEKAAAAFFRSHQSYYAGLSPPGRRLPLHPDFEPVHSLQTNRLEIVGRGSSAHVDL